MGFYCFFLVGLFSVYLCHLKLKSFCDFIVVCNVNWQYFKDIIFIIIYLFIGIYAWSIIVIWVGVLTPIHWKKKKNLIIQLMQRCIDRGNPPSPTTSDGNNGAINKRR